MVMTDAGTPGSSPYRCADDVWLTRRREGLSLARDLAGPTLPGLARATVASIARLLAGAVGLVGALAVATLCCVERHPLATYALLGSSGAALVIMVVGRVAAHLAAERTHALPALPALTGSAAVDRQNLERHDPLVDLDARVARVRRLRRASLGLPLAAASLLGPLTLHYPFAALGDASARDFGQWIVASGIIVGLAHLTLVGMSLRYVGRLLAAEESGEPLALRSEWGFALAMVVLASCLPGVVLLAIPPVLTAVTGVVLVPAMFHWAHAALRDDARATGAARTARQRAEWSAHAYEAAPYDATPSALSGTEAGA